MRVIRRLSPEEFETITANMRLSEKNCEAAKAVLVDGFRLQAVAEEWQVPVQVVSRAVQRIWRHFLAQQEVPDGWQFIQVALPPVEAEKVLRLAAELKNKSLCKK